MFSPYYAWSGRRDPLNHVALNVALYGEGGGRWAMTERGRKAVTRTASHLAIGPSHLDWNDNALTVRIDEVGAPLPARLRGTVRLTAPALPGFRTVLDEAGQHHWQPIAPRARIEVDLDRPSLRWTGSGYFDSNAGTASLESGFAHWTWSRATLGDDTVVLYDMAPRAGGERCLALRFSPSGAVTEIAPLDRATLPTTRVWRIGRGTRADPGDQPRVLSTLEDTPFYARSLVGSRLLGEPVTAVHESLNLDRFAATWVRLLLPFRMPRRSG